MSVTRKPSDAIPVTIVDGATINVDATFPTAQEVVISHLDDSIKIGDGTDLLAVNPDGSINVVSTSGGIDKYTYNNTVSSATDVVASVDVSDYSQLSIQIIITATATVTFYASNDNSNWSYLAMGYVTGSGGATTVIASNNILFRSIDFRYFKATVTSYINGSITAYLVASNSGQGTDPAMRTQSRNWNLVSSDVVTVVQSTGTSLHTVVDSGTLSATQSGTWTVGSTAETVRVDETSDPLYIYFGFASPGSAHGSAVWRIKRLTNADNTVMFADGNSNYDNVWNNRTSLTYS